ncbi:BhlA/UviB family holin-like peptide [Oceanobacillus sp. J11TS1]|uniref:BhlA/UviB family holin-like peptide n=1 Tax=Oceanobacillus sp. J11TS1 TaxID=2807191 RepID=UPI001B0EC3F8|nr:BhlA/UviB family holin-like peptide [Oceanobacillus sp. J11TS1]GIO22492.1 hypothetical protein J11TS1_10730 [Oceanobacillus sp. J11TS1]
MDITAIPIENWLQQGIFALLFVWLLFNQQKDSKAREERLMEHLNKTTDTLDTLSQRMENVSTKVDHIDTRLTKFEAKGDK